jgi:hypothetical protein
MLIELTDDEVKKFEEWKLSFGVLPDIGFTGGHFGLEIIFTSIGNIITAKAWNGEELLLTEIL